MTVQQVFSFTVIVLDFTSQNRLKSAVMVSHFTVVEVKKYNQFLIIYFKILLSACFAATSALKGKAFLKVK